MSSPTADEIVCVAVEAWLDRPHDIAAYGAMVTAVAARRQAQTAPPHATSGRHRRPGQVVDEPHVVRLPTDQAPTTAPPTSISLDDVRPARGGAGPHLRGGGRPPAPPGQAGASPTDGDRNRGRHRRTAVPMM